MAIPRTWSGSIDQTDLSPSFVLPMGSILQGSIVPDKLGLTVVNKSGGSIAAGSLVYVSGRDSGTGLPAISKASAAGEATIAYWVTLVAIANNGTGGIGKHYSLTAQNTNAATVGDFVYLDTTAGGYTLTTGPTAGLLYQRVGTVSVKSATVGVIEFNLMDGAVPVFLERLQSFFPAIATTGATESAPIIIDRPGAILGFRLSFLTALAINGTNFVTLTVNNRTQTLLLTSAVVANSTNTGGQAITQYTGYVLTVTATPANLAVAAADVVTCLCTVTGTLGGVLGPGTFSLILAPN